MRPGAPETSAVGGPTFIWENNPALTQVCYVALAHGALVVQSDPDLLPCLSVLKFMRGGAHGTGTSERRALFLNNLSAHSADMSS